MTNQMSDERVTEIETLAAPYGRTITLQDVAYESGLKILRMRIREGSRFTIVDFDAATAGQLGGLMAGWAEENAEVDEASG